MSNPIPLIVRVVLLACLASAALMSPLVWGAEPVKIGVLAFRPKPQTLAQWQPLAVALKRAIPSQDFVLVALTFPEMEAAVASRQLDFVLTNPGHYVLLTKRSGLSAPLATLVADDKGQNKPVFGGVMFTLATQTGINTLSDIEGKTVAITSIDSLGGYQMQAFEMSRADLRLPQGDTLVSIGMPHDKVVEAVLAGRAEVGFVRSGVLEAMALEGALDPGKVKVLNRQNFPNFAPQVSTRLYPDWTFAALPHINADLAKQVAAALFLLEENTATTRAMGIHGFGMPADYTPVAELLKELRLPPFESAPRFTLQDVWARYRWPLLGALLAFALIVLLGLRLLWVNRRLTIERHRVLQQKTQLQDSEERYRVLVEWSPEAILVHRMGSVLFANAAAVELFGATTALELLGKSTAELIHPDFQAAQAARMKNINDQVAIVPMVESRFVKLDGTAVDVQVQGTSIVYDGELAIHVSIRDITERKHAEAQLHLAASVFTFAREAIMITAADGSVIDVNDAFTRITGYSREEILGKNPRMLASGRQSSDFYADVWRDLEANGHWFGEVWNRHKDGDVYAVMQTISTVRGASGVVQHYVALFSDITAIKEHQLQLEHIAHYDPLTNLPNRVLMADRMRQGMAQAQRRGQSVAVAYLDLDGFKAINDRHGHEAGDQLLIALASRMKQALREGDTLARIGGDEFVAVLVDLSEVSASVPMLTRLLHAAAEPVQVGALALQVSASLGVTFYPQAEEMDADQLLRQADQAMYQAKLAGKNRYHLFDAEQDRSVRGHHESQDRVQHALQAGEFMLYYQPKVNMRTGKVVGAEALIRWQHPEQGLLLPAAFLPVIENHPLAVDIGEWVINTALTQMELWHADGLDIPVSVNVGARQLQQPDFVDRLRAILAAHPGIQPSCLELEVLETSALEDVAGVSRVIETCRDMGVMFALDDFGTGYSSLTYLKRLPASLLKIDQSFVRDMLDDPDDLAILEGVIGLATAFRRNVIAEGVETLEHGALLLQLGCDQAQGYGIARPMPAHHMPAWCVAWRPDAAWGDVPLVNRDDLPLLFASVEHRAWIRAVEHCLTGEHAASPSMDHEQCHFGTWLKGPGFVRHGAHSAFGRVDALHRQAHDLAIALCALRAGGERAQAVARLGELHTLGDALLEQVYALMRKSGLENDSIYQEEMT